MTDAEGPQILEPVHAADGEADGKQWSYRLVVFLRVMGGISGAGYNRVALVTEVEQGSQ